MLALVVGLAGVLAVASPAGAAGTRSCGWQLRLAGDQANVAYPDQAAQYWLARLPVPPGGSIDADGIYPHARYISFITYTGQSQAIDGIADTAIAPDAGSSNPFLTGADRTTPDGVRHYRVHVVNAPAPPGARAANTVYNANADGSKSATASQSVLLIYRVYEADRGRDIAGGVGLPRLSFVDSTGARTAVPDCPDSSLPDAGVPGALGAAGTGPLPGIPPTGLGGRNPPVWLRYTNVGNGTAAGVLNNEQTGSTLFPPVQQGTNQLPSGGFYENVHNAYVLSFFDNEFGQVLVLHAKAPITPRTLDGQPTMTAGELRYWSFCTNTAASNFLACLNDDAFPRDAAGAYTLVMSAATNRPANARPACGVQWLPTGPTPQTVLILRNMLPDPSFAQAVQRITQQGTEAQVMGDHYPRGRYYTTAAEFAKLGCAGAASGASPSTTPSPSSGTCGVHRLLVRLRRPHRARVVSAKAYVGRRRVGRGRGRSVTRLLVHSIPAGAFTLRIVTRTSAGRKQVSRRRYGPCGAGGHRKRSRRTLR